MERVHDELWAHAFGRLAALVAEYFGGQVAIGILAGLMLLVSAVVFITQKQLRQFQ